METMRVKGADREFVVKIVWKGDPYGRDLSLTNYDKPIVEFYDATYAETDAFGPYGQFVGSYYIETLLERDVDRPLSLWTSIPEWTVPAEGMAEVREWLTLQVEQASKSRQIPVGLVVAGDS